MRSRVVVSKPVQSIAGVYKAVTSEKRNVYGYGKNVEDATKNILPGLKWNETIKSISREEFREREHI